jgi:hypothetical protein
LRIQHFVVLYNLLRFTVAFDQQLIGRENMGVNLSPLLRRQSPKAWGLAAGLVLVLAGELMGRALFYGLHMTTGVAIAG